MTAQEYLKILEEEGEDAAIQQLATPTAPTAEEEPVSSFTINDASNVISLQGPVTAEPEEEVIDIPLPPEEANISKYLVDAGYAVPADAVRSRMEPARDDDAGVLETLGRGFDVGLDGVKIGYWGTRALMEEDPVAREDFMANLDRIKAKKAAEGYDLPVMEFTEIGNRRGVLPDSVDWAVSNVGMMAPFVGSTMAGAFAGGKAGGATGGLIAGPKGAAIGTMAGSVIGSFSVGWGLQAGGLYSDLIDMGASPAVAKKTALNYGAASALADIVPEAAFASAVLGTFGKNYVRSRLKNSLIGAGIGAPSEGASEAASEAFMIMGEEVATGREIDPEVKRNRLMNATAAGALMGVGIGAAGGAMQPRASVDEVLDNFLTQMDAVERRGAGVLLKEDLVNNFETRDDLTPQQQQVLKYLKQQKDDPATKNRQLDRGIREIQQLAIQSKKRTPEENFARYNELIVKPDRTVAEDSEIAVLQVNQPDLLRRKIEERSQEDQRTEMLRALAPNTYAALDRKQQFTALGEGWSEPIDVEGLALRRNRSGTWAVFNPPATVQGSRVRTPIGDAITVFDDSLVTASGAPLIQRAQEALAQRQAAQQAQPATVTQTLTPEATGTQAPPAAPAAAVGQPATPPQGGPDAGTASVVQPSTPPQGTPPAATVQGELDLATGTTGQAAPQNISSPGTSGQRSGPVAAGSVISPTQDGPAAPPAGPAPAPPRGPLLRSNTVTLNDNLIRGAATRNKVPAVQNIYDKGDGVEEVVNTAPWTGNLFTTVRQMNLGLDVVVPDGAKIPAGVRVEPRTIATGETANVVVEAPYENNTYSRGDRPTDFSINGRTSALGEFESIYRVSPSRAVRSARARKGAAGRTQPGALSPEETAARIAALDETDQSIYGDFSERALNFIMRRGGLSDEERDLARGLTQDRITQSFANRPAPAPLPAASVPLARRFNETLLGVFEGNQNKAKPSKPDLVRDLKAATGNLTSQLVNEGMAEPEARAAVEPLATRYQSYGESPIGIAMASVKEAQRRTTRERDNAAAAEADVAAGTVGDRADSGVEVDAQLKQDADTRKSQLTQEDSEILQAFLEGDTLTEAEQTRLEVVQDFLLGNAPYDQTTQTTDPSGTRATDVGSGQPGVQGQVSRPTQSVASGIPEADPGVGSFGLRGPDEGGSGTVPATPVQQDGGRGVSVPSRGRADGQRAVSSRKFFVQRFARLTEAFVNSLPQAELQRAYDALVSVLSSEGAVGGRRIISSSGATQGDLATLPAEQLLRNVVQEARAMRQAARRTENARELFRQLVTNRAFSDTKTFIDTLAGDATLPADIRLRAKSFADLGNRGLDWNSVAVQVGIFRDENNNRTSWAGVLGQDRNGGLSIAINLDVFHDRGSALQTFLHEAQHVVVKEKIAAFFGRNNRLKLNPTETAAIKRLQTIWQRAVAKAAKARGLQVPAKATEADYAALGEALYDLTDPTRSDADRRLAGLRNLDEFTNEVIGSPEFGGLMAELGFGTPDKQGKRSPLKALAEAWNALIEVITGKTTDRNSPLGRAIADSWSLTFGTDATGAVTSGYRVPDIQPTALSREMARMREIGDFVENQIEERGLTGTTAERTALTNEFLTDELMAEDAEADVDTLPDPVTMSRAAETQENLNTTPQMVSNRRQANEITSRATADGPGNLEPRRQTGDRGMGPDDAGRADRPSRPQLRADAYLAWLGEQARTSPDLLRNPQRAMLAWGEAAGLIQTPEQVRSRTTGSRDQGAFEHHVYDTVDGKILKVLKPGRGYSYDPLEYLVRLSRLQTAVPDLDIDVTGMLSVNRSPRFVTEMARIAGEHPDAAFLSDKLAEYGWADTGNFTYLHRSGVSMTDAAPDNFIRVGDDVVPFDVIFEGDVSQPMFVPSQEQVAESRAVSETLPPVPTDPMPMSAVDVLYRDSAVLPKPAKKIKNAEVATILADIAQRYWGFQLNSENITPEIEQIIVANGVEEFISALRASGKNAADWYSTAIEVAMEVAGVIHPEITNAELARGIPAFSSAAAPDKAAQLVMRIALAVTSQNLNVNQNAGYAEEQYAIFRRTGKFDSSKIYGEKAESISGNLELANQLIAKLGFEGAEAFIQKEFSVDTLQKEASAVLGRRVKIAGKKDDIVNGAALFGPKIGQGFLQNLMGRFNPVTIDLWMRRTWGRWTGDVVGDGVTDERMAKLLDAAREDGLQIPESLRSLRTVERKRKNGKSYKTMSSTVADRLETDPDFRASVEKFAAEFNSRGQAEYRLTGQPVSPRVAASVAAGNIPYKQFIRDQQGVRDGLDRTWDRLRKEGKKPAMSKASWVAEQHRQEGRTEVLDRKVRSDLKPRWSRSAKVIISDLNPIDIPSPQDRRVITRIVNKIREDLSNRGYSATNADVQAVLWYPEKDLWAKLRGEEESNLKLSYDDEFISIAEERGLGEQARAVASRIRADRAARTGGQDDAGTDRGVARPADASPATDQRVESRAKPDVERNKLVTPDVTVSGPSLYSIAAWHSSPFQFDRFSSSKIGTGEGAQVYGYGLYFAENESVSGDGGAYQSQFAGEFRSGDRVRIAFRGQPVNYQNVSNFTDFLSGRAYNALIKIVEEDALRSGVSPSSGNIGGYDFLDAKKPGSIFRRQDIAELVGQDLSEELFSAGLVVSYPSVYKVDLDVDENLLLDWDATFKDQSPQVKDALVQLGAVTGGEPISLDEFTRRRIAETGVVTSLDFDTLKDLLSEDYRQYTQEFSVRDNLSGDSLYFSLVQDDMLFNPMANLSARERGERKKIASDLLRSRGIQGIRYRDQYSRTRVMRIENKWMVDSQRGTRYFENEQDALAYANEGVTSNYVIFDENLIKIVSRDGQPVSLEQAAREQTTESRAVADPDDEGLAAAEVLNNGRPVDTYGLPRGARASNTTPEGDLDIADAQIDSTTRSLVKLVGAFESATDKLRRGTGLTKLADYIDNYFDLYEQRLGLANGLLRRARVKMGMGSDEEAVRTFESYMRARENKRAAEAKQIYDQSTEAQRAYIDAWEEYSKQTGAINTQIRTPDGKPMQVYDTKLKKWRPIQTVRDFFPRTMRQEVQAVLQNPALDPALYNDLLDSLVAGKKAESREQAQEYLKREYFGTDTSQDYFAGVERGRREPLPEIFYDYSVDAIRRYMKKWAQRTAQIEAFGQATSQGTGDWFDNNITKVRDQNTRRYLNQIKERIYEVKEDDAFGSLMNWLNVGATGLQLGNPATAFINLFGGSGLTVTEYGWKNTIKAAKDVFSDWKNVMQSGADLGIVGKDLLNVLNDADMEGSKYFTEQSTVSQALAKFASFTMKWGGYSGAENFVRATTMLAARGKLMEGLRANNTNPSSSKARWVFDFAKRENLDANKLVMENGAGPETGKFLRKAVNVPQGSYRIDMTPIYVDQPLGRFLFKYQKFGTQLTRMFWRHHLQPFIEKPDLANFSRLLHFFSAAIASGTVIVAGRAALFGYPDPGPDEEDLKRALANKDTARAWGLIFSRAWHSMNAAGALGFFGNYFQFVLDWRDQQRVKNPLKPPGLASIDAVVEVLSRLREQGKLTGKDIDEIAESTIALYRANKRIGLSSLDAVGIEFNQVKEWAAEKQIRRMRKYSRMYADDREIEGRQRSPDGRVSKTPMSPLNRDITLALRRGDAGQAKLIMDTALKGAATKEEREAMMASIQSSVRFRQPLSISGRPPSSDERADFFNWARRNAPPHRYESMRKMDEEYRRAAARLGVSIK